VVFCPTIIVQALKPGFDGYGLLWRVLVLVAHARKQPGNFWKSRREGRTRGDHAAGIGEANVSGRGDEPAGGTGGSSPGRRSVHIGNPGSHCKGRA
jgi:hypothetical protein